ncbi:copper resistance D family protein [Alkalihalobacillus oceani]|uniref:Copper resistance D family protein n=1 Tax=Halalkalibacter oceani TaxID=1653776 RepID=A0A9X2IPC6_9BACI|nr:copper resistance D family protein [Halalkalibacter oceani]MCM3713408.1 copper resistance D family protein [Halalkalibacter oceani]
MEIIGNLLLYASFILLIGYFTLSFFMLKEQGTVTLPLWLLKAAVVAIPLSLLLTVIRLVYMLYSQFQVEFFEAVFTVLLQYAAGQAFLFASVFAWMLLSMIPLSRSRKTSAFALLLLLVLIITVSWAGHGAAVAGITGLIGNSLHLAGVAVWIGPLTILAWAAKDGLPGEFFRWFSPLAVFAVVIVTLSGFLLMNDIVPQYVQAWQITYGQLLLLKHLIYAPLLLFGLHHFWLGRRKPEQLDGSGVIGSFRLESLLAYFILAISAFMTEQTPPHEVAQTLQTESIVSVMFLYLSEQQLQTGMIGFAPSVTVILILAGATAIAATAFLLLRRNKFQLAFSLFLLSILVGYHGVMSSLTVQEELLMDQTVYPTIESAVSQTYENDDVIEVAVAQQVEDEWHVVYTVNGEQLVAEKLQQAEGGFKRLPAAMLTVGGTAVVEEEQKIRTFRVESGNWHDEEYAATYVTFGMIQQPENVARVQIHYEGGSFIAPLENQVFLHVTSSNETWQEEHPIDFLADDGTVMETYARNVMERGIYCH